MPRCASSVSASCPAPAPSAPSLGAGLHLSQLSRFRGPPPKALDELVSVRRLMRAGAVVDVECQFAPIRVKLVGYRGIKPFGQGLGAGQMRGDEDNAIGRFQTGLRQV